MDRPTLQLAIELRDQLLADLQANPTFRAYHHIEAAIVALNAEVEQVTARPLEQSTPESSGSRHSFKPGTQTAAILTATMAYLRQKGTRAQSGEILKVVTRQGIKVGGKYPSSTLASYLSHSALFDNVKDQGYGLVEWSQPKTETPNSGTLFGAPRGNGSSPLSP